MKTLKGFLVLVLTLMVSASVVPFDCTHTAILVFFAAAATFSSNTLLHDREMSYKTSFLDVSFCSKFVFIFVEEFLARFVLIGLSQTVFGDNVAPTLVMMALGILLFSFFSMVLFTKPLNQESFIKLFFSRMGIRLIYAWAFIEGGLGLSLFVHCAAEAIDLSAKSEGTFMDKDFTTFWMCLATAATSLIFLPTAGEALSLFLTSVTALYLLKAFLLLLGYDQGGVIVSNTSNPPTPSIFAVSVGVAAAMAMMICGCLILNYIESILLRSLMLTIFFGVFYMGKAGSSIARHFWMLLLSFYLLNYAANILNTTQLVYYLAGHLAVRIPFLFVERLDY